MSLLGRIERCVLWNGGHVDASVEDSDLREMNDESPKGKVTLELEGHMDFDWREREVGPTK